MREWLKRRVREERSRTLFTFAAPVTVTDIQRIATLFPSRILRFLRVLLFQDEINFHDVKLIDGISRLVLAGANKP